MLKMPDEVKNEYDSLMAKKAFIYDRINNVFGKEFASIFKEALPTLDNDTTFFLTIQRMKNAKESIEISKDLIIGVNGALLTLMGANQTLFSTEEINTICHEIKLLSGLGTI